MSEDVLAAIKAIKKLGIKSKINNNECEIFGKGREGYKQKKNIIIKKNHPNKFSSITSLLFVFINL